MFGSLKKDLSLIDNVTERSVRYMYLITNEALIGRKFPRWFAFSTLQLL